MTVSLLHRSFARDGVSCVMACVLVLGFSGAGAARAGQAIGWMYEADVPILNQSREARVQAAEAGFRQVLGRLTGMGESGLTLDVSAAKADRLMTRFSFHSEIVNGRRQPRVKLSFNPAQTLATVRKAGLPVWASTRVAVKLYLVVQAPDGSWVPMADDDPLRTALARQAWVRGLVLTFPVFDDQQVPVRSMIEAVNPNRPAGEFSAAGGRPEAGAAESAAEPAEEADSIEAAEQMASSPSADELSADGVEARELVPEPSPPEPFLPGVIPGEDEFVLVGEFRFNPSPAMVASPELSAPDVAPGPAFSWAIGSERGTFDGGDAGDAGVAEPQQQAMRLIDQIADELAKRFAVPWIDPRPQPLLVNGVDSIEGYAELMGYLGRQEFLSRVDLLEAGDDGIRFSVVTPASPAILERLFQVDSHLRAEEPGQSVDDAVDLPPAARDADAPLSVAAEPSVPADGATPDPAVTSTRSSFRWQG